jgi:proline iminopeptidase
MSESESPPWRYPEIQARKKGHLQVSSHPPHEIYWEEYGNPKGDPVMYLHGGPGSWTMPPLARFFDPMHYRIILFDQRGTGKSRPAITAEDNKAGLANNMTPQLIEDINALRFSLVIRGKMHLFGGSWGSTLALAYAIKHPDNVKSMMLRGIFLCRKKDIDVFYQGDAADPGNAALQGIGKYYPDEWSRYVEMVPQGERGDMVAAYRRLLDSPDKAMREEAARRWSRWEGIAMTYEPNKDVVENLEDIKRAVPMANLENHYFMNSAFLGGSGEANRDQNYIIEHIGRIKNIPTQIVHGKEDRVCPVNQAEDLVAAWNKAQPDIKKRPTLITPERTGHGWGEPAIFQALCDMTEKAKKIGVGTVR